MAWSLVGSDGTGFSDITGGGHSYNFGGAGAPSVGDLDVLCVNSDTVISTPTGFTKQVDATSSQGAYIFTRIAVGGEAATVAIVGTPVSPTALVWGRFAGANTFSAGSFARLDGSAGAALPALATGTLAQTNMLVVAYGALHNATGGLATSPVWTNSFTALGAGLNGSSGSSTTSTAFAAYLTGAGTASVNVGGSLTWTNNQNDRYALYVAFTASAAAAGKPPSAVVAPSVAVHRAAGW